jgi:Zn finger protein HypA/HybF involved in hydrogenase expression
MPFVHCRECGHEINADTKQTRCEKCGTFFPFTCAVCDKFLRPPFAVYDDERYVNGEGKPLCQDHYQRQCPECKKWFQADENPGYFLCLSCAKARQERATVASASSRPLSVSDATAAEGEATSKAPAAPFDYVVFAVIGGAAVIGILYWLLTMLNGGGAPPPTS